MIPSDYRDRLTAKLTEDATSVGNGLVNGGSLDYASYREQVGFLRGLRLGMTYVRDVYSEMFEEKKIGGGSGEQRARY